MLLADTKGAFCPEPGWRRDAREESGDQPGPCEHNDACRCESGKAEASVVANRQHDTIVDDPGGEGCWPQLAVGLIPPGPLV